MSRILIELVADGRQMEPGLDNLERMGVLDSQNRKSFEQTSKTFTKSTEQVTSATTKMVEAINNMSKAGLGKAGAQALAQFEEAVNGATDEVDGLQAAIIAVMTAMEAVPEGSAEWEQLNAALQDAQAQLEAINQEQLNSGKAGQSMRSNIRQSREELAKLMMEGKLTSYQIYQMAKGTGEMKDAFGDASKAISVLGSDTFGLDATIQGLQTMAAGFQLVQGTAALFGDENEELTKTLVKLNGIMAVTSGLQQIANALQKETALSLGISVLWNKRLADTTIYKNAVQLVENGLNSQSIVVRKLATAAQWALNSSIMAFPAVAIIAALAAIAGAFVLYKTRATEADKATKALAEVNEKAAGAYAEQVTQLKLLEKQLKDENISRKQKNDLIAQAKKDYPEYLGQLKDEEFYTGKLSTAIEKQILLIQLRAKAKAAEDLIADETKKMLEQEAKGLSTLDKLYALFGVGLASYDQSKKSLENQRLKEYQDNIDRYSKIYLGAVEKINKMGQTVTPPGQADKEKPAKIDPKDDPYYQGAVNRRNQEAEQKKIDLAREKQHNEELKAIAKKRHEDYIKGLKEAQQRAIDDWYAQKEKEKQLMEEAEEAAREHMEKMAEQKAMIFQTTLNVLNTLAQVADQIEQAMLARSKARTDAQIADLERKKNRELKNKDLTESQKAAIEERYQRKIAALKNEQAKREHRAAVIKAITDTALAVLSAAATKPFIPLGIIAMAQAAVLGATQTAIVARQPIPQFAKGTRKAPAGFKWVGEQGAELIHDGGGYPILNSKDSYALASLLDKYGIGHSIQTPDTKALAMPGVSRHTLERIERSKLERYGSGGAALGIDYTRLGKAVAQEIAKNPKVNISLDKNGFQTWIQEAATRTNYVNNRHNA